MELFRLHAYAVFPKRTQEEDDATEGGAVRITQPLRGILDRSSNSARFDERTLVDFEMGGETRFNTMRELIVRFGFEDGGAVKVAATGIAGKLAQAMDMRSQPCLLVLTAMREGTRRRVTVWTFPRDHALRLQSRGDEAAIQILTDVFSQTSKLRKAAQFEGHNSRTGFLQGRVLDLQANQISHEVANFWINRFLTCTPSIADDAGTRMLAKSLRRTVDSSVDLNEKEQLITALMAVRTSPKRRWSLQTFADDYLTGPVKARFLATAPNRDSAVSLFNFRRAEFESALAFRVFTLDTGVLVSSPLVEIGESVTISEPDIGGTHVDRELICRGIVADEKVRSRHVR